MATIQYSSSAIGNFSYAWDANHNKTSETISGVMSGYGFTATYDDEDRLLTWDRADSNLEQSWNLSAVGNWNSVTQNATTQSRTHSPANEILTAASQNVQHDPKGNATLLPSSLWPSGTSLAMRWDFNNKLRAADINNDATDDVFYLWDALGRRVGRTASGVTTIYVQNDQQTVADYPSGTLPSSPSYTYLWGDYIDELVLRTASAGNLYFHRNQQYSVTAVTTSAGAVTERYAYSPYGELTILNSSATPITSSATDNRYTYTGREWDSMLRLYYFRARMMSPVAGRFLGRDPIGYFDGFNLMSSYFGLSGTDPAGLETLLDIPATPEKCQKAIFWMKYYALLRSTSTHDNLLLNHYMGSSGRSLILDFSAFDHWGVARRTQKEEIQIDARKKALAIPCNSSGSGLASLKPRVFTSMTLMINSWTMTTHYTWTASKNCWKFCGRNYACVSVKVWIDFNAYDITDFNKGVGHSFGGGPVVPRITDDLIVDCNVGKSFKIYSNATEDFSFSVCT